MLLQICFKQAHHKKIILAGTEILSVRFNRIQISCVALQCGRPVQNHKSYPFKFKCIYTALVIAGDNC